MGAGGSFLLLPNAWYETLYVSGESLLVILMVGIIAGWLAGQIMQGTGFGIVGDVLIEIVGAFIGSWLLPQLGIHLGLGIVAAINDHARKPTKLLASNERVNFRAILQIYPVHVTTRKSFGLMTRKLSVTESQRSAQFPGTFSRKKTSVASANWAHVA